MTLLPLKRRNRLGCRPWLLRGGDQPHAVLWRIGPRRRSSGSPG